MLFSSLTFLFIFLPLVLLIYFISKDKYKNIILLIFSLIFYAYGEPRYIALMLFSIVLNYFAAILIDKYLDNKNKVKLFLVLDISINLLLLIIFKYTNLIISTINGIFKISIDKLTIFNIDILKLTLPIGISFYTFQILSYVIDLYRGNVKVQKNYFRLLLYVSFFPQLIAGPIVRYETVENEIGNRKTTIEGFIFGFKRFIWGLGKKSYYC